MTHSTRAAIAIIASTLLTVTAPAGAAHASEAGYLARLAVDYDFEITAAEQSDALKTGYYLCDQLRGGTPRETLAAGLQLLYGDRLTPSQTEGLAYAAQRELCPDTAE